MRKRSTAEDDCVNNLRRTFVTSVLLIAALAASASGCLAGWGSQSAVPCSHPHAQQDCTRKKTSKATAKGALCGDVMKSLPGRCGMRSFIQLQFVELRKLEISTPPLRTVGNISATHDSTIIVSSIGSSETDRGPPCS